MRSIFKSEISSKVIASEVKYFFSKVSMRKKSEVIYYHVKIFSSDSLYIFTAVKKLSRCNSKKFELSVHPNMDEKFQKTIEKKYSFPHDRKLDVIQISLFLFTGKPIFIAF